MFVVLSGTVDFPLLPQLSHLCHHPVMFVSRRASSTGAGGSVEADSDWMALGGSGLWIGDFEGVVGRWLGWIRLVFMLLSFGVTPFSWALFLLSPSLAPDLNSMP